MEARVRTQTGARPRLTGILPAWKNMRKTIPGFGPIRDERAYARMKRIMDGMLDAVGDNENHELADLLDIVSTLIMQYEELHHPKIPDVSPREVLKHLMEQHELTQSDLRKEIGSQGVVSEILAGARELNTRQISALARRFRVSPAVFIA